MGERTTYLSLIWHLSDVLTGNCHEGIRWSETILIHGQEARGITVRRNTELSATCLRPLPTAWK